MTIGIALRPPGHVLQDPVRLARPLEPGTDVEIAAVKQILSGAFQSAIRRVGERSKHLSCHAAE
jgi:hypothetical protein